MQSHQSCLCSTTQNYKEQLDSEGSDKSLQMCSLTRAVFAQLHQTMRNSWTAMVQMSLCICAVSPELSLLNYTKHEEQLDSEGSDVSLHMCSLTRAPHAFLQTVKGIGDQRLFRLVCAYVQSHQSFYCSTTQNCEAHLDSEGSHESLHMCSFTRAFIDQLHKTMSNSWSAKVQMCLCICAV